EDGIRDFHVTGVQTCALPIFNRGEHLVCVLRAGERDVLVDTHEDDVLTGLVDRFGGGGEEAAGDREEHVCTLLDLASADALGDTGVGEVADEVTLVGGGRVPAENGDRGAGLCFVRLGAVVEAVHERGDTGDVHSTVGADDLRGAVGGGEVAGEVAGLVGRVLDGLEVVVAFRPSVNGDEVHVGVGSGGLVDRGDQVEADREGDIAARVDHGGEVRLEVFDGV